MKIHGITVDEEAIARGMFAMLNQMPEEYQSAAKFGMLPAPLMDLLSKQLAEKFDRMVSDTAKMLPEMIGLDVGELAKMRRKFVSEIMHKVSVLMLGLVKPVV